MPKKACCCKVNNCCDDIFYSNFIILAGETMDDAAPVDPDDVIILTLNRPGSGGGQATEIYPNCSGANCRCKNCDWLRTYWMTPLPDGNGSYCPFETKAECEQLWNQVNGAECGPY